MVLTYNVGDHKWLQKLYEIHEKWCMTLSKDTFDGGIKSSQRSESTNNVLNEVGSKTTLTTFVVNFEKLVVAISTRDRESRGFSIWVRMKLSNPSLCYGIYRRWGWHLLLMQDTIKA